MTDTTATGPLLGLKVIEICTTIAGPACARLLADMGAEVIKIEPPEGDPVRQMGQHFQGESLYAASILRNKRSIVLDLKTPEGRQVAADLIAQADILVENNRPGVLERLNLGYDTLSARNPGLVMVRISGYGQTGPYHERPGYGAICEAVAGVRHMTGDPDRPPARVALATTDYFRPYTPHLVRLPPFMHASALVKVRWLTWPCTKPRTPKWNLLYLPMKSWV